MCSILGFICSYAEEDSQLAGFIIFLPTVVQSTINTFDKMFFLLSLVFVDSIFFFHFLQFLSLLFLVQFLESLTSKDGQKSHSD